MDSDEYDDDIADEDLIVAASQAPARPEPAISGRNLNLNGHHGQFHPGQFQARKPQVSSGNNFNSHNAALRTGANSISANNKVSYIDLDELPSDAFSSSPLHGPTGNRGRGETGHIRVSQPTSRIGSQSTTYRQTTLFGLTAQVDESSTQSQPNRNRAFRADLPPEAPSHHDLDLDAMKTWVYPTNLGPTRDYQFSIVKNGLFNNVLVALPTGLGKTFIAATIMLNFYRWTKKAKIVFLAPTKPLVAQQVSACFDIAGIPRSDTTLLTGETSPALRAEEWDTKRVFFMTPQTLENDLSSGSADPKSIALLVIDEAHRATGNYAYVKAVTFMRRFTSSFRVLALTATPGTKAEAIQEVVDNLGISHVEIRTEESIDIRQYVHNRDEDIVLLDPSEEMALIKDLFSKALKPLVDKLSQQNIYYGRDPMSLTTFGLLKARKDWLAGAGNRANQGVKFMMMAIFSILQSLAHAIKLLNFHGIKPFYDNLVQFRDEVEEKGAKAPKNKKQITDSPAFQEMMRKIATWSSVDDFVSHPKLTCLCQTILNHFLDAGEGRDDNTSSSTRIIVFSEYRDSAEEIVRVLNRHKPTVRAAVFVGQADSKRSEGMKQAEQIERIKKFKEGAFNVLVATSIGEEGLDIGQVDLIICYDASASPIRMLQRMGRTGRKRAGRVVLLLMKGKEEDNYAKSKDAYEKLQRMICEGSRFTLRHDLSTRIVPRDIKPEVDMRAVEIPIENTQNQGLPEPKKGRVPKKKPPKKFHMPDGVETGFTSVASMLGIPSKSTKAKKVEPIDREEAEVVPIPDLKQVLLQKSEVDELNRTYKEIPYYQDGMGYIDEISLTSQTVAQRTLRKTVNVKHGELTKRCVKLFRTLARSQSASDRYKKPYGPADSRYKRLPLPKVVSDTEEERDEATGPRKKRKVSPIPDRDTDDEIVELPRMPPVVASKKTAKTTVKTTTKTTSKKATAPARGVPKTPFLSSDIPEDITDGDEEEDEEPPAPPPARKRAQAAGKTKTAAPKRRGKTSKPKKGSGAHYDESADEGDDCRRTSDLDLTDDSDEGSDLVDFVVGDDVATSSAVAPTSSFAVPTSSLPRRGRDRAHGRNDSTSPTSPSSSAVATNNGRGAAAKPKPKPKPWYEPTQFPPSSQETDGDDEMPSMSQLVSRKRASKSAVDDDSEDEDDEDDDDDDDDDGDDAIPVRGAKGKGAADRRTKKRRTVLDDEDEDEDESDY